MADLCLLVPLVQRKRQPPILPGEGCMCARVCANSAGSRICKEESLGQNVKLLLLVVVRVVKGGWEGGI